MLTTAANPISDIVCRIVLGEDAKHWQGRALMVGITEDQPATILATEMRAYYLCETAKVKDVCLQTIVTNCLALVNWLEIAQHAINRQRLHLATFPRADSVISV
jgi:hypothetical protein